ncbi:S41 family peptidase [Chitinophaga sp. RAB17]|uniref:S41 family peptidase n=1 Tax=Chitinophaga sp. RAB17 TaxID=3233049 RepID=UPI003F90594A
MDNFSPVNKLILTFFCIAISNIAVSQQPFKYTQQGWRSNAQGGVQYQLKTNTKDPAVIDFASIEKQKKTDSTASFDNTFHFDSIITQGAIILDAEFQTDLLTNVDDAGIAVLGSLDGNAVSIYRNLSEYRLKNHDTINKIHLVIPFETPMNKVQAFVFIKGKGKIQLKHLTVTVTKGEFDGAWQSKYVTPLTQGKSTLDKLALYTKVWGFLKYYAPSISEKHIDWDAVFVKHVTTIFESDKAADFQQVLRQLIQASEVVVATKATADTAYSKEQLINYDDKWLQALPDTKTSTQLRLIKKGFKPFKNYYIQIDTLATPNPTFQYEDAYNMRGPVDIRYRLLMLARYWNIIQYYYPYKYAIGEDWNAILEKYLPVFTAATTRNTYLSAMLRLNTEINDGHATTPSNVSNSTLWEAAYGTRKIAIMPMLFRIIDSNQVVVVNVDTTFSRNTGIVAGDKILSVNRAAISTWVSKILGYVGASNLTMKYYNISKKHLLSGIPLVNDSLQLVYKTREGKINYAVIPFDINAYKTYGPFLMKYIFGAAPPEEKEVSTKILPEATLYIDISKYTKGESAKIREQLPSIRKAIIDLRKYPSPGAHEILSLFAQGETPFVNFMWQSRYPAVMEKTKQEKTPASQYPIFNGKVVLLIDEGTMSKGELFTMILQTGNSVTLIGRATAGADGNISSIPGIGVQSFFFSGLRVTYPDQRETQRIGIQPTIPVTLSEEEAIGETDPILQRALKY